MTSVHSADLQYNLVAGNNKFLQKRGGVRLSSDPFNNSGKATRRHNGSLSAKAAVVKIAKGKQIVVTTKDGNAANAQKPRAMYSKKVFPVGVKASEVAKAVGAVRPDLKDVAFRRARRMSHILKNTTTVRAATKKLSEKRRASKKAFKRTAKRTAKK